MRWRCRRGMRELDVLLLDYLNAHYSHANDAEQRAFERLLEMPDPLIMAFVLGREAVAEPELADVVHRLTRRPD